jgi:hypothetical protein
MSLIRQIDLDEEWLRNQLGTVELHVRPTLTSRDRAFRVQATLAGHLTEVGEHHSFAEAVKLALAKLTWTTHQYNEAHRAIEEGR